jgi:arylsulfatase A
MRFHHYVTAILIANCTANLSFAQSPSSSEPQPSLQSETQRQPNIIFILVDDLGYGELGSYGQSKIKTPQLDKLAKEGMKFTQFYAGNTVCAPSRAALITGRHTGKNQIRGNYELGGFLDEEEFGQLPLKPSTATLGTMLKAAGYQTALIGKWGLGGPGSYGIPTKQGFDYFYGYLDQKQAHNHTPTHLWRNEDSVSLENAYLDTHQPLKVDFDPTKKDSFNSLKRENFAQDSLTNEALSYVEKNKNNPFFLYLSYAGPHAALQAPESEIEKYNFPDDIAKVPTEGNYIPAFKPRAARAAMVSYIDKHVGQLVDKLRSLNLDKDTLVIFTSDNGPSFEGGADLEFFDANGPLRGYKRDLYEGGIRMPMIAWWPGKITPNSSSNHVGAFWDMMPTFAQAANINTPETDGISILPTLLNKDLQKQHQHLYWEFHHWQSGHSQAIRQKNWKAVRFYKKNKSGSIYMITELYNLDTDLGESVDLADKLPLKVKELEKLMDESRTPSWINDWNFDT